MSHCFSAGVNINGEDKEVCLVTPGNEDIKKALDAGEKPKITKEHIDRAVNYYLEHQHEEDKKIRENPSRSQHQKGGTLLHGD
jgi:hypothetical protein